MTKSKTKSGAKQKRKVAILTSGGDSPGMNTAIYATVRHCIYLGFKPYVVYEGYKGLVENNIVPADINEAERNANLGGTYLYSARLPEFAELSVRQKAVKNLTTKGIKDLIVIGGDGSYQGARLLTKMGINCIGLPGTIDNDIGSSDYTIGFYTALESIDRAAEQVMQTCISHDRVGLIEVMGRYCGDLALYSTITSNADLVVTAENYMDENEIAKYVKNAYKNIPNKRTFLIIVTERMYGTKGKPTLEQIAQKILEVTGKMTNVNRLGYLQRGGHPATMDRMIAVQMGMHAVELIKANKKNRAVGIIRDQIVDNDFDKALSMRNPKRLPLMTKINKIQEKV